MVNLLLLKLKVAVAVGNELLHKTFINQLFSVPMDI